MVKLHSSEMFVKDPIDVWGKEVSIGPAEQAIRTQFPYVYNRSGNVIYWDDFESPTLKPVLTTTGVGTAGRSVDHAEFGDFSMKLKTGTTIGNTCTADYYINNFRSGKIGVLASLMTHDVQLEYVIGMHYFDGNTWHFGRVKINVPTGKVYIGYPGYTEVGAVSWYTIGNRNLFIPIKMVIDIENGLYDTIYIARNKIDVSTHNLYTTSSTELQHFEADISIETLLNASYTAYMDNMIITDNES